ncbi:MAG: haloacid dehalogenase-like hydrolase [Clostridia bacterium]|nr:haloacid dehalogenase-like hydrolase [Clostridia bacterium]
MPNAIIALMYDFDRTLSTQDMQNYRFIPALGMTAEEFWSTANKFAADNTMDGILAYMYTMVSEAKKRGVVLRRETLVDMGRGIEFFPGLDTWFSEINAFGASMGVTVEHYVISSGLREIIQGSSICHEFREVFAGEFLYDADGMPVWPKAAVNYTNKTQFIYRINKGVLDISNDRDLNESMPDDDKRVRFSNMIYLGDGLSDVPCMKMVKAYGGKSIAVYNPDEALDPAKHRRVLDLITKNRVDYIYPADYRKGKPLEATVKHIIEMMAIADILSGESHSQRREALNDRS